MPSWQSDIAARLSRLVKPKPVDALSDIAELRRQIDHWAERFGPVPADAEVTAANMGAVKGEWLTVEESRRHRVLLYLHGGGYVAGSAESYRPIVARLAKAAEAQALTVEYRLAPEFPYPAALRDALDAYRWLLQNGISARCVGVVGDFNGGGLALALCLAARNADLPVPAACAMISPWADLSLSGWSILGNARNDAVMSWELLGLCARHYLNGANPTDQYASPLYGDFRNLPPLMIHTGANEMLKDDASRIGHKAVQAGVPTSVEIYDGMQHFFQATTFVPEARISLQRIGGFVKARTPEPVQRRAAQ